MSREELRLSNQLCFLFYRAEKAILARYRPLLEKLDLTYPQYIAMLVLWERGRVTVGELCAALTLDTGTISPLVKRLEARGLVQRTRDASDPRRVLVALTQEGATLEGKAASIPGRLASCVGLDRTEYLEAMGLLTSLLPRLEGGVGARCDIEPVVGRPYPPIESKGE